MFFNRLFIQNLILLIAFSFTFSFLLGCAAKQPLVENDPELESAKIQTQKEQEQFKYALGLIQTENVQKKDLLKAKEILDALYESNSDYLGALINSADISLKLEKLDEAKALYLEAIQNIEQQKIPITDQAETKNGKQNETSQPVVSEHISRFTIHVYNQLGLIERQQGNFDQAEAYYRKALALDSDQATSLKNLAILLDLYRGKLAEALALYEQYQGIVGDSDPKIKDWIYDLKNRLPVEEVSNE
tara:strand:+ start:7422 stop:8159 length:738 start_codon:yes stop_codon:yes gene_type:complete